MKLRSTFVLLGCAFCMVISGCQSKPTENPAVSVLNDSDGVVALEDFSAFASSSLEDQLEKPEKGEEIAVISTNLGDIYVRLFPEVAPKAVYNFKKLALEGYYDGLIFHRVISDFMIQSGDPKGDGTGGQSIWKEEFDDEFSKDALNLKGSLSMANSGSNTNGSQFFINQAGPVDASYWEDMEAYYEQIKEMDEEEKKLIENYYGYTFMNMDLVDESYKSIYQTQGGNPSLDGAYNVFEPQRGHTVFGQVFKGLDVVDAIASVQTDDQDKPLEDITIETISIVSYDG